MAILENLRGPILLLFTDNQSINPKRFYVNIEFSQEIFLFCIFVFCEFLVLPNIS